MDSTPDANHGPGPGTEPKWPPILARRGEEWVYGTGAMATVSGVFVGIATGPFRASCIAILVTASLLGTCILCARRERQKVHESLDTDRAKAVDDRWQFIIRDRIGMLALQVVNVVGTEDPQERRNLASSARTAILALAAADVIGTKGGGVRMNLFRLAPDEASMSPERLGSQGRSGESTRVFTGTDETMRATMAGQSRFVANVKQELGVEDAGLVTYETFATVPVGRPAGTVWGALTVDAPSTGDLDKHRDVALMNLFAALIAVTYESERFGKPRR